MLARGLALAALAVVVCAPEALAQCAMCKTALTNSAEGRAMGAEFNRAILVMIAAPYLVLAGITATLLRHRLRACLRRLAGRGPLPAGPRADIG
ncbi:MAG TPA: hypothetical protein VFM29_10090 [Vicinamibacteria bacterium]|nr:hypothetical protein [Vicinamibacteria bacterium]